MIVDKMTVGEMTVSKITLDKMLVAYYNMATIMVAKCFSTGPRGLSFARLLT